MLTRKQIAAMMESGHLFNMAKQTQVASSIQSHLDKSSKIPNKASASPQSQQASIPKQQSGKESNLISPSDEHKQAPENSVTQVKSYKPSKPAKVEKLHQFHKGAPEGNQFEQGMRTGLKGTDSEPKKV